MEILDGKQLAQQIKAEIRQKVDRRKEDDYKVPHLAAVIVGDNPASKVYVRNKVRSCDEVGFESTLIKKDDSITTGELLEIVQELNENPDVDGFIVQLPLPKHIDEMAITLAIDPEKDVDGFHPVNFGKMTQGLPSFLPATPMGILEIIRRYKIETSGKKCVVVGRSNIVGTPISILLSRKSEVGNCTVTLTHSRTRDLPYEIKQADIIIAAIGIPNFIDGEMIKEGAVIIDVGINRQEDANRKKGYKLVGDVDWESCSKKASFITPVPGGVGPMTVVSLLLNTLKAASGKR